MELQQLYSLMDRFGASGLTALEWEHQGERVALRKEAVVSVPAAVPAAPAEREEQGEVVSAPLVGVFYAASAPEESPYVTAGAHMKMMSEVPAPADCVVEEILARDGEAVGMGAPLFRIRRV